MTEETVDKIVIELDYELAKDAKEKINAYEKMAETTQKKAADMQSRLKNVPISEKIKKLIGASGSTNLKQNNLNLRDEQVNPLSAQKQNKDLKANIQDAFQKTTQAKIDIMRTKLAEKGYQTANMSDKEIFYTNFDINQEKIRERETLARQKEEKKRTEEEKKRIKETLAAEKKGQSARNSILTKALRSFSTATAGYIGIRLGRSLYSGLKNTAQEASSIKTSALMANTNTQGVQAVQKWFKENNVDPERGIQTLSSYARFMGMSNVPLDKILPQMIRAAKSGSAQAAVAHGADPDAIRAFREYSGNAIQDLSNFKQNPLFTDEEIKKYEKAQKIFSRISDTFERLKVGAFTYLLEKLEGSGNFWNKLVSGNFWNKLVDEQKKALEGTQLEKDLNKEKKDFISFSDLISKAFGKKNEIIDEKDEYFKAQRARNPGEIDSFSRRADLPTTKTFNDHATPETMREREEYIKKFQSGRSEINVTNNFTINSTSPEDVGIEVQNRLDRKFFEQGLSKNFVKPTTVF